MCGLTGILYFDPERAVAPATLDAMTDVMFHRGPDGRGTYIDGRLGLGHRRLAIIDLTDEGSQPMSNEDGSVWVVLNGELYDYDDLRSELEAKGHVFRSRSDTEILVHLYEEEGPALVERLRGMYAFAIWDAKRAQLTLARDRFGQKPLYYRLDQHGLWFGSELKAILADPEVPRAADPIAIHAFLTYAYVPAPMTAFSGINKLPPGHRLVVSGEGRAHMDCYWRYPLRPRAKRSTKTEAEHAYAEVRAAIDEAVEVRLASDVPLGAFLSGGVDSSAIVAAMCAQRDPREVRTYSIGFQEKAYDESPFARRVAEHLGTDHTELTLEPSALPSLDRLVWHYGEPFADASMFPTYAVSKLARDHVTVALSGDGGDELFVGYERYRLIQIAERAARLPGAIREFGRRGPVGRALRAGGRERLADLVQSAFSPEPRHLADRYLGCMQYVGNALKEELYTPGMAFATRAVDAHDLVRGALSRSSGLRFADRCAEADVHTYLPDDILTKVDVASMAVSLEARAPLLDHHLAEVVGRLPFDLKLSRLESKRALKRAVASRLPREVIARRKQGFGVPLESWFRGELDILLRETLLSPAARERGWFRPEVVERIVEEHASGAVNHRNTLFPLLVLETWAQSHLDRTPALVAPA